MLAVILKMKPLNFGSYGLTVRSSANVGRGLGAICTKQSNRSFTPNLFSTDPTETGANSASNQVRT